MQPKSIFAEHQSLLSFLPQVMACDSDILARSAVAAAKLADDDMPSKVDHLQRQPPRHDVDEMALQRWFEFLETTKMENCSTTGKSKSSHSHYQSLSSSGLVAAGSNLWSSSLLHEPSSTSFSEFREQFPTVEEMDDTSIGCDMIDDEPNDECDDDFNMDDIEDLNTLTQLHMNHSSVGLSQYVAGLQTFKLPRTDEIELNSFDAKAGQHSQETPKPSLSLITVNDGNIYGTIHGMDLESQPPTANEHQCLHSPRLAACMMRSNLTMAALQEWDRQNGLPASHARTMVNTARSRKQLQEGVLLLKWNGTPLLSSTKANPPILNGMP